MIEITMSMPQGSPELARLMRAIADSGIELTWRTTGDANHIIVVGQGRA